MKPNQTKNYFSDQTQVGTEASSTSPSAQSKGEYEYRKITPLGQGHFVFTPIRTKRFLQKGWKSDVLQLEEVKIKMDYVFSPNGAISDEEMVKLHEEVRKEAEKLLEEIEILSMASKIVPDWLGNEREYLRCVENFSSKYVNRYSDKLTKRFRKA